MQVKAWTRRRERVLLSANGGHNVQFAGQKIFPLKFLLAHYSLRSQRQASQKIFRDRLPRIADEKKRKGWHCHYDAFLKRNERQFIWPKQGLIPYVSRSFNQTYLIERLTGIGLRVDEPV